jgi:hypothetical protein
LFAGRRFLRRQVLAGGRVLDNGHRGRYAAQHGDSQHDQERAQRRGQAACNLPDVWWTPHEAEKRLVPLMTGTQEKCRREYYGIVILQTRAFRRVGGMPLRQKVA